MPCIVESPVASTIGSGFALAPPSPTTIAVRMRSPRTRSSARQRPRSVALKRRLASETARGKARSLQRASPPTGPMQRSVWMPPMPQRSSTRTLAFEPGFMRLGAVS